jgi:L-lactate dehydrogenase complex protein LldG
MAASSKAEILRNLRDARLEPVELPDLDQPWTTFADRGCEKIGTGTSQPLAFRGLDEVLARSQSHFFTAADRVQQFSEVLQAVGGRAVRVHDLDEVNRELDRLPAYAEAAKVCALTDGIRKANVRLEDVADPHELEDVDFFVAPGQFGVAENAAVWITDQGLRHRVLYFLTQHLALILPARELLDNMDQAYQRLSFTEPGFGLFLSGPSKTADIEQALVIGAHGARSLTVFLVG